MKHEREAKPQLCFGNSFVGLVQGAKESGTLVGGSAAPLQCASGWSRKCDSWGQSHGADASLSTCEEAKTRQVIGFGNRSLEGSARRKDEENMNFCEKACVGVGFGLKARFRHLMADGFGTVSKRARARAHWPEHAQHFGKLRATNCVAGAVICCIGGQIVLRSRDFSLRCTFLAGATFWTNNIALFFQALLRTQARIAWQARHFRNAGTEASQTPLGSGADFEAGAALSQGQVRIS